MADIDLKELEDLLEENDLDDMDAFMSMLDSVGVDDKQLEKELEQADTPKAKQQESVDTQEAGEQQADMPKAEKKMPVKEEEDAETAFVTPEEDDILNILDAAEKPTPLDENAEADVLADESVGELADILAGLENGSEEETEGMDAASKKGFIRRMIDRFQRKPTPEELLEMEQEEAEVREWEEKNREEAAEKKRIKKEAAEKKKKENEEKKKAEDAAKSAAKAAKDAKKAAAKAEAKAKKESQKNKGVPRSQLVPVKPLMVFIILGIACSVVFILFTNNRFYNASISESKEQFIHQKYKEAYESLFGLEIKKKDEKFYDQVKTVRIVDKDLDAYYNYIEVKDYERALESLVKGVGKYGVQSEKAKELNLENEMHNLYEEMIKELTVRFAITAQDAVNLYQSTDQEEYQKKIAQIARDAAVKDGVLEPVEVTHQ